MRGDPGILPSMGIKFVAFDFETANYQSDSACSIGLVRVEGTRIVRKEHHLIRPPYRNFAFSYIHGLSWNDVADASDFGELWPEIKDFFDGVDFVAAHNVGFDRRVLLACCERYKIEPPKTEFVCTVQLARQKWNIRPTKLPDVCGYLKIKLTHHHALSDAEACAKILLAAR